VVGAGPVGLTLAGRLAQRGLAVGVVEAEERLRGEGSKALCMQRETLEVWARLGVGEQVAARGVHWTLARTYYRDRELFATRLPSSTGDHFPPFVNISQTEVERLLLERAEALGVRVLWRHRLVGLEQDGDMVRLTVATPAGPDRTLSAAYAVAADGSRSAVRGLLGVGFPGHSFDDRFLIADIHADLPFPRERRFFFDPPFNPGRTVLVHPQPDSVWRIDWQVPPEVDVQTERASGALDRRIRRVVGDRDYELVWLSAYRFSQRLADRFRVGRVFLVGDAAHVMSPFGARGLNSGVADAENLAWKLALVLSGRAPESLLESFEAERRPAAVENLAVTGATMRFMVPSSPLRRRVRNAVLRGSVRVPALRRRVNSGRLAEPFVYAESPLVDGTPGPGPRLGGTAPDARVAVEGATRLRELLGASFVALFVGGAEIRPAAVGTARLVVVPPGSPVGRRYAPEGLPAAGRLWLVRPDGHLAARRDLAPTDDLAAVVAALVARACGGPPAASSEPPGPAEPAQPSEPAQPTERSGAAEPSGSAGSGAA
jgi:2-polyprenyl-6-methoxyphenol hydroxylase-like FAD-dependent oxidoreductase